MTSMLPIDTALRTWMCVSHVYKTPFNVDIGGRYSRYPSIADGFLTYCRRIYLEPCEPEVEYSTHVCMSSSVIDPAAR